ncbi:MAG: DEAD/DEAH box helicase [Bacteroidales bacterium]|nr:DEAD/DEAH box helicase [Bacteroidales bacterium]MBN2762851.1 DEAD/DEAH box helicase [Bacteroidales bacterium]
MEGKYAIALIHHRILGYVFQPVVLTLVKGKEFFAVTDRISKANLSQYQPWLDKDRIDIVQIVDEYSDNQLLKVFSKKKVSIQDFFTSVKSEFFDHQLRPYLEKRMIRCIDILTGSDIPVYQKKQLHNVYETDLITITEEKANVVFNFDRTTEGLKYFLTIGYGKDEINLTGKGAIILTNDPCTIILEKKLYRFDNIDGKKLVPFFGKSHILINKNAERKYFESFVSKSIRQYAVNAKGFEIRDTVLTPVPVLSLDKTLEGKPILALNFRYDEKTSYPANKKTEPKVTYTETSGEIVFKRLIRNYSIENHFISALLKMGLINRLESWFIPLALQPADEHKLLYELINWLNFNSEEIQQQGIEVIQEPAGNRYYLNDIRLHIDFNARQADWFDLKAIVSLDEYEIPFARFHHHILEGRRDYALPDGRIFILPDEWFAQFRDLVSFAKPENECLRLSRQHFPLLENSLKDFARSHGGKLKKLLEQDNNDKGTLPAGINASLRDYQKKGYHWMLNLYHNAFGGCLSDDMGLGKTLQTITLIQQVINLEQEKAYGPAASRYSRQLTIFDAMQTQPGKAKPSLVVVPTSLVHNWLNEVSRFAPGIRAGFYGGPNRKDFRYYYDALDLIVVSYGIVRNDIVALGKYSFLYIILDESQIIKNPHSKTYKAVSQLQSSQRLVLTGTPIENSLTDLWAQMNFLNPGLLGTFDFFRNEFVTPIEKEDDEHQRQTLRTIIKPFILRRTKNEVAPELPDIMEQKVWCDMSEDQNSFYESEKSKVRNLILDNIKSQGYERSAILILQSLTRLRQIANHPRLADENYQAGSGKFDVVLENLENILAEGHKALVFSSFVKHLKLFTTFCDNRGISYKLLTGETRKRQDIVDEFQKDQSTRLFFISIKAGGFGLNLTAADYVFLLDPWWNPAVEEQAVSRAHRIGQEKNVFIYRFISRDTIEEKILKLQEKKSQLAELFAGSSSSLKDITAEQIMELLR